MECDVSCVGEFLHKIFPDRRLPACLQGFWASIFDNIDCCHSLSPSTGPSSQKALKAFQMCHILVRFTADKITFCLWSSVLRSPTFFPMSESQWGKLYHVISGRWIEGDGEVVVWGGNAKSAQRWKMRSGMCHILGSNTKIGHISVLIGFTRKLTTGEMFVTHFSIVL